MESFGDRLKKERERRGIALEEVSMSTKIGVRMLQALEEERFEQLPGGIFNKGFVRAYARHLGLNEEEAVADYLEASGTGQAVVAPEPVELSAQAVETRALPLSNPPAEGSRAEQIPWEKFALGLLLLAFGFALWGWFSRPSEPRLASSTAASPGSTAKFTASTAPAAGSQPPTAQTSAAGGNQSLAEAGPPATAGGFLVLVRARQDSWVEITADGQEIMHDTLTAASHKAIEAHREIVVKAGNIGGLDFSFNGKPLPVQGDHNQIKILNFDPTGLQNSVSEKPSEKTQTARPQV